MTIEYDDKGKYYTDVIKKHPLPVVIQTTNQLVRGQVHIREGERLKNELERDEAFLAVTQVSVYGVDDKVLFTAQFMAVRCSQIIWIMPAIEEQQKESSQ